MRILSVGQRPLDGGYSVSSRSKKMVVNRTRRLYLLGAAQVGVEEVDGVLNEVLVALPLEGVRLARVVVAFHALARLLERAARLLRPCYGDQRIGEPVVDSDHGLHILEVVHGQDAPELLGRDGTLFAAPLIIGPIRDGRVLLLLVAAHWRIQDRGLYITTDSQDAGRDAAAHAVPPHADAGGVGLLERAKPPAGLFDD